MVDTVILQLVTCDRHSTIQSRSSKETVLVKGIERDPTCCFAALPIVQYSRVFCYPRLSLTDGESGLPGPIPIPEYERGSRELSIGVTVSYIKPTTM
jgi:hypothetical protein